ncbi:cofactor assembly of complex C subunit B [filamentous cyanobacterium LEGE 11480]|uniref:Cofactor assembly of complex C subunit B n=2 Tax=Romeriopsis TaxID=2992131 RepID=A0A928VNY4_9CYAN|nr:cofactor assembly of complex C subunit B [Romeriopsis navalis LEGE 11480]
MLKRMPIVVGIIASSLLVVNRILTPNLAPTQSRSDALGIIISAVLILTGLLWQNFQPNAPESVDLIGESGFELEATLPDAIRTELAWASKLLLNNTVTKSIVVYHQGKIILRRGILGKNPQLTPGAIVKRVLETQKAVYLVALKLYPGRVEFDYLPENTQGVICQPIDADSVIILGANAPRSYTKQDEAWIAGIADKLSYSFNLIGNPPPARPESTSP